MDIGEWLRSLGLERYEPAFRENEIDSQALRRLTVEDLKDLGVVQSDQSQLHLQLIGAAFWREAECRITTQDQYRLVRADFVEKVCF